MRLGVEDEPVVVPAGTLARVPPLVVHGFRNASDADVALPQLPRAGSAIRRLPARAARRRSFSYDQHDPPEDGGRPTSEAVIGGARLRRRPARASRRAARRRRGDRDLGGARRARRALAAAARPPPPRRVVLRARGGVDVHGRRPRARKRPRARGCRSPPGTPHTFAFTGSGEVRFLDLHTPSCGYGAFLRGLHEARTDDELAAVRAAFDQEPV